jgi:hypothetical protein
MIRMAMLKWGLDLVNNIVKAYHNVMKYGLTRRRNFGLTARRHINGKTYTTTIILECNVEGH